MTQALVERLNARTIEGDLYRLIPEKPEFVQCYACAHYCKIRNNRSGICKIRFNDNGVLRVPYGYVGAWQCDPIEKKPFFHAFPGTHAMSFGMLGCDYHCGYCFTDDTVVITDKGPETFKQLFNSVDAIQETHDGYIGFKNDLRAITSSGKLRDVKGIFKHKYKGKMVKINPLYLPEIKCTSDHEIYATTNPNIKPGKVKAKQLTKNHLLAIPRSYSFSSPQLVKVDQVLNQHEFNFNPRWKLSVEERNFIMSETEKGKSSNEIGETLGKSGSYIRHVRSKMRKGLGLDKRKGKIIIEDNKMRFSNERRPGIPVEIQFDVDTARLFGLYCAEGCVVTDESRPNSYKTNFTFSHEEEHFVKEVRNLITKIFGISARKVIREDTIAVAAGKTSIGLLFKYLVGVKALEKKVPEYLFDAPREVVEAFVNAYIDGDGHRYESSKVSSSTVSIDLAYGIAWLVLKLGYLPSIYINKMPEKTEILGREVNQAEFLYNVVWYENSNVEREFHVTDEYFLIPIRSLSQFDFDDYVYNMEVENEHNYLAGFFLVANCQNWLTSQALKDPRASARSTVNDITPQEFVNKALDLDARVVTSTYNEPLITSEWAVAIFKVAREKGLATSYVSNGNATPEVLDYLKPYLDLYKIDLKTFQDKNYRKLGGTLEAVLKGIKGVFERGMWLEIVTLIVPSFNDSDEELQQIAEFIANISPDIPWHVTAFHKDYKMTDPDNTSVETLVRAAKIGEKTGLNYVYAGNLPGQVGKFSHTRCPQCEHTLIARHGFEITDFALNVNYEEKKGYCPKCGEQIPGRWEEPPERNSRLHFSRFLS
ncbi:MAG: radical SAM protein [Candidatus Thorarchaeota archaeon]